MENCPTQTDYLITDAVGNQSVPRIVNE